MRQPIAVELGGPDDPFPDFPSSTSARARRHFEATGEKMVIQTMGHHVIAFVELHCVLTDSHYAGKPFQLMDWQKRALLEAYEVTLDTDGWIRVHRWVCIGIPKKNGKTELAAALAIYHAIDDDEPSAKVVCAAVSDDQADLLFGAATRMVTWSDTLNEFAEAKHKTIEFESGSISRLAAVSGSNDGKNLSAVFLDELHEWVQPKARAVFNVLTQGGGARRQPINFMITTAGSEEESICYEWYERGQAMLNGELDDATTYFCWFEASPTADYTSPKTWESANPSWGLILKQPFYEDIITKRSESVFCRYFLNRWMEGDEIWEAAQYWPGLEDAGIDLDTTLPLYVGIDIGRRHDTCAVAMVQWTGEDLIVRMKFWMNPETPGTEAHKSWAMNVSVVEEFLLELYVQYPEAAVIEEDGLRIAGPRYEFDPHFFIRSAELLSDQGCSMVEFPQTDARMVPASQNLFELIKTGHLTHDGHPQMGKQIRSVVPKQKERGWRMTRPTGRRKAIDGPVALAMAAYACSAEFDHEEETFSIF